MGGLGEKKAAKLSIGKEKEMMKGLMKIGEVIKYLGLPKEIVEGLIKAYQIYGVKIDDEWFFSRSLIDKWIEEFVEKFRGHIFEEEALKAIKKTTNVPRPKYKGEKEKKTGTYYIFNPGAYKKK